MIQTRLQAIHGEAVRRFLGLLILCVLYTGCTRELRLIDLSDGETVTGATTPWNQKVTLTLPTGELAEGDFLPLSSARISEDSLFYLANLGTMFGGHVSGRFHGYAHLTGTEGTVVEIIFSTDWTSRGFGFARTSQGREYRVTF